MGKGEGKKDGGVRGRKGKGGRREWERGRGIEEGGGEGEEVEKWERRKQRRRQEKRKGRKEGKRKGTTHWSPFCFPERRKGTTCLI